MAPFSNLLAALADVPNPAGGARQTVSAAVSADVHGAGVVEQARSYRGVITFLEQRREHLNHHFGVDLKRAPVVNTLRTVLQSLPTEALEGAFRRHAKTLLPAGGAGKQPVIALDGKTLRGSFDRFNDRKAAQTLTAFASASAIVLAHIEIDGKSNEIPAAQQIIRELGLTGAVFTADALHCQKNL
ncbi:MAG: ISAs1 family transposase [Rhodospirillales bacterium]